MDWLIGVECTSFKGALERFALCLNSLKNLAVHIKLMRESKIMTLSNNEKCNTNYNERREWCLHFLGKLSYIEKFLRINWMITRAIKLTVWTKDKIFLQLNVARGTDVLENTKNFLLRFTLLLTAPKLHLLLFCGKLSYLLTVAWTSWGLSSPMFPELWHFHFISYNSSLMSVLERRNTPVKGETWNAV